MRRAQKASGPTFIARGKNLFEGKLSNPLAQGTHTFGRPLHLFGVDLSFGSDSGDGPSVARDDDTLAPFDIVENSEKMSFNFRGLNTAHKNDQSND
jgi:hypothetical protein